MERLAKAGEKLGAKMAVKEAAKYTIKETMQGAGMYGASSIASDLGITPKEQLMAIGGLSLFRSGKSALKNPQVNAALNNAADISKATVKDAIEASSGKVTLNSNFTGTIHQLHESFKTVTKERKAFRKNILDDESSITISQAPKNTKNVTLKELHISNGNQIENNNISYKRPSGFRKGVRDRVWESAKNNNGNVIDPLTKKVMNKIEPWDMGHKPGFEFRKHKKSAEERSLTRKEFLDEHNNSDHYRPELPSSNRSHKGEDLTDSYFGD